eukprot:TRINITY_DN24501_c0_g1_i1.p1 TRINITY_DN24501_c0_g1~~TRINITY_DN24501_c0_g1_i1.p1  ORF type:complete len:686 (-),score=109.00 TRINITY_DN24501_c0_g1_i1:274-2331(-)
MESVVRKAVGASCPAPATGMVDYLGDIAASVLEDEGEDRAAFADALHNAFLPFLDDSGVSAEDAAAFCQLVVSAAFPASEAAKACKAEMRNDVDVLCRLDNLKMMYGGSSKPLLNNAMLELFKGHCYGVVGANGTGKTTLIQRIASKSIADFPASVKVVHLSNDLILRGVGPATLVSEYHRIQGTDNSSAITNEAVAQFLADVGFDEEMMKQTVQSLSGGWQMRLALACAVAQKSNLLLLDEPTNHLDTDGVQWLVNFMKSVCVGGGASATAIIISHDAEFLDLVCTDVVHFTSDAKLTYHPGNFESFKTCVLHGDQAKADSVLETGSFAVGGSNGDQMKFPVPSRVGATAATRKAAVVTLQNASFRYEGAEAFVLRNVNVQVSMDSRVAIVGANGAGKSTLLALLADRLKPSALDGAPLGELWTNEYVKVAYIAQQHLVSLANYMDMSPVLYVQARYIHGYDIEAPEKEAAPLSPSDEADRKRLGIQFGKKSKPVQKLLERKEQIRHAAGNAGARQYIYRVQWENLPESESSWEGRGKLEQCGAKAMLDDFDDRLFRAWAGVEQRPLSEEEIIAHFAPFGLPEEVVRSRKISMLSSGQKVKLMFGAALWTRAHILFLDEPTNFLDAESVGLLQEALKEFKGGYAVVTHNEVFAKEVCTETWTVTDGQVMGAKKITGKAKAKAKK